MPKLKVTLVSLAAVGACAFGAWTLGACVFGDQEAAGAEHLANHVWLERLPTDERDMITHFLAIDSRDGRFGLVGRSSTWRHVIEVFKWSRENDRLTLLFPQERTRASFNVRTWECKGEAPAPFELCLELARGDRSVVLYSRHDWVVEPHDFIADSSEAVAELVADNAELRPLASSLGAARSDVAAMVEADDIAEASDAAAWALLGER